MIGTAITLTVYGGYKVVVYLKTPAAVTGNTTVSAEQSGDNSKTSTPEPQPELQRLPDPDEDPNGNLKKTAAAAAVAAAAKNVTKEIKNPLNSFDQKAFAEEISKLHANERVGRVRDQAKIMAKARGWNKDSKLSERNGRDVYVADKKTLYAVDPQHGTFEKINSKTGQHLGEFTFDLDPFKTMDKSGGHNLKVK